MSLEHFYNSNEPIGYLRYTNSILVPGVNSKLFILISIISTMFTFHYGFLNTSSLPEESICMTRIARVVKNPQSPKSEEYSESSVIICPF